MNTSVPPTAALPCPFCGAPAECTDGKYGCSVWMDCPAGCAEAKLEQWNTRAPAVQATADADELAREIYEKHCFRVFDPRAKLAEIAAIIRKAVSPKAAQEGGK